MAAVVIPSEELTIPRHLRARLDGPGLRLVPEPAASPTPPTARRTRPAAPARPEARSVRPGRQTDVTARPAHRSLLLQVWAMRLALAAVAVFLGLVGVQVVAGADSNQSSASLPTPAPAVMAAGDVPAAVHVVRPGDTLWSIAADVAPGRDPRPVVDELARRAGGATLQVGQRIALDGLAG
jgi:hypothetical protein